MADLPPSPDANGNTNVGPGRELTLGIPRWVKVFGIVALVLVLLVIIMLFVSGGNHGPGSHIPSGGAGSHIPSGGAGSHIPSGGAGSHMPLIAHGVQQP